MYHFDPTVALEELREESLLPNPVHIRDMIIRARLTPEHALDLNHRFHEYMQSFADTQKLAKTVLEQLALEPRKQSAS